ncbi:STAS/SEC14 domain-containing protein [Arthrobacter sp. D1-29]
MKHTPIDSGKATLELLPNGVVNLTWQRHANLEIADVTAAMASLDDVCHGVPHPLLVDMGGTMGVSHDAREAFSAPSAASRIALLGSTPVDRILANFRPAGSYPCPTRFFTDRTEAMSWLLQDPTD